MSVLGSQLEIDMDPEGDAVIIPRHQGNTGTGCYKLFDHDIEETRRVLTIAGMAPHCRPHGKDPENERGEDRGRTIVFTHRRVKPNRYSDTNYRSHPQEHLLDAPILSPDSDFVGVTLNGDPKLLLGYTHPSEKEVVRNPFDFEDLQRSEVLDHPMGPMNSGSMEMMQFKQRMGVCRTTSADETAEQFYKSLDRFGSLDSEDAFLSCNSHPFPSQGSLAGLEQLAAMGTMAPNGSMPAVNIPSFNKSPMGYTNPMDSSITKVQSDQFPEHRGHGRGQQGNVTIPVLPRDQQNCRVTLTTSSQGSPLQHRVRIVGNRSVSSDLDDGQYYLNETFPRVQDGWAPEHKRSHASQNNHNNNGGPLTITLVKLSDDDHHQRPAVNNNVPSSNESLSGLESARCRVTSSVTSKEIQTSTTNIPDPPSATAAANKKYAMGRGSTYN